jgi:hypothetical protein
MGVDFFVHGVFGVKPDGPFIERFYTLLIDKLKNPDDDDDDIEDEPAEEFLGKSSVPEDPPVVIGSKASPRSAYSDEDGLSNDDEDYDEDDDEVFINETERLEAYADKILEDNPDLLLELREQYQAPGAELFYTGSEDERPGRCACDPEIWLFGYGLFSLATAKVPPAFVAVAEYYSWVEAG